MAAPDVIVLSDSESDGRMPDKKRRRVTKLESNIEVRLRSTRSSSSSCEEGDSKPSPKAICTRKGERMLSPSSIGGKKRLRTEERRSLRQALRRGLKGPIDNSTDVRVQSPSKGDNERSHYDEDVPVVADQEVRPTPVLHPTCWRHVCFDSAPLNVLPTDKGVPEPFARSMDRPLAFFDHENLLQQQAEIIAPLPSHESIPSNAVRSVLAKVESVLSRHQPRLRQLHSARVDSILRDTRRQIASYKQKLPAQIQSCLRDAKKHRQLPISAMELETSTQLLRNSTVETDDKPKYTVGVFENEEDAIETEDVVVLRQVATPRQSTAYIGVMYSHREEDDPIIRYVPHYGKQNSAASDGTPHFREFNVKPNVTVSACDDEVKEYLLRIVVKECGTNPVVFDFLKEKAKLFEQPLADYRDLVRLSSARRGDPTAWKDEDPSCSISDHLKPMVQNNVSTLQLNPLKSQQQQPLGSSYRNNFCRLCFIFCCPNHGLHQPMPDFHMDPKYPAIDPFSVAQRSNTSTPTIASDAEEEKQPSANQDDDAPMREHESTDGADDGGDGLKTSSDSRLHAEEEEGEGLKSTEDSRRRSVRSQTAAATRASSKFRQLTLQKRLALRARKFQDNNHNGFMQSYDESEFWESFDVEQPMENIAFDCGDSCCRKTSKKKNSINVEANKALLTKVIECLGSDPCLVAGVTKTGTCAALAHHLEQLTRADQPDPNNHACNSSIPDRWVFPASNGNNSQHLRRTRYQRMKDKGANHGFKPCNHPGASCNTGQCSCMRRDHFCGNSCGCAKDCMNRFPGCKCAFGMCRTASCPCFFAGRECDPDLCFACGVTQAVIAADKRNGCDSGGCGNANILIGAHKRIGMAASKTHGWGAFALEDISEGEFIYEYTGSILTQDEAERRGAVYDQKTVSFLFDLNEDAVVDATRKGNKSKFANHTSNNPNCRAKIMCVCGDHRIGLYAARAIVKGEELFFDYGYSGVVPDWTLMRIRDKSHGHALPESTKTQQEEEEEEEQVVNSPE